jgi:hypothetical protein
LLAFLAIAAARPEVAVACDPTANSSANDHCYSLAYLNDAATHNPLTGFESGAAEYIDLECVGVPDQDVNILTDETWADMANGSWIEAGVITGDTLVGDYTEPGFFVSFDRTNVSGDNAFSNEVLPLVEASPNTWNLVELYQAAASASTTWDAWTYGTGTVTVPGFAEDYSAQTIQAGIESTDDDSFNEAVDGDMVFADWTGTWHTGWSYEGNNALIYTGSPNGEFPTDVFYGDWDPEYTAFEYGQSPGCGG